ncbi:hypothetical protein Ancab_021443 [Ancistrocladus abbreviatus]
MYRSSGLKFLQLACYYGIWDEGFRAITKLPLLEEVELPLCNFSVKEIKAIGYNYSLLKTFKLNHKAARYPKYATSDEEALAIEEMMPQLCHLQLIGKCLTNKGLEAILDSSPHLESLDLRACLHIQLNDNMRKRCVEHVKELRWPDDPTNDYKYDAFMEELWYDRCLSNDYTIIDACLMTSCLNIRNTQMLVTCLNLRPYLLMISGPITGKLSFP